MKTHDIAVVGLADRSKIDPGEKSLRGFRGEGYCLSNNGRKQPYLTRIHVPKFVLELRNVEQFQVKVVVVCEVLDPRATPFLPADFHLFADFKASFDDAHFSF